MVVPCGTAVKPLFKTPPAVRRVASAARVAKLGFWMDRNPIPPWDFRKAKKAGK